MKLTLTRDIPRKEGFYWYCNFGEHTPTILKVHKSDGRWWAQNEEFTFEISKQNRKKIIKECKELELEPIDGFYHGEELWCYIPNPYLPNGKEQVEPDSY